MRRIGAALVLAVAMVVSAGPAAAQRVALLIGNGTYRHVPALTNPGNDAKAIEAALGRLGFKITLVQDAGFDTMRKALRDFGRTAAGADMAVVFFAGHGMEIAGENFLVPIDAELQSDTDAEQEAISLKSVMLAVSSARRLGLVVLDACRNNPFLAKMQRSVRSRAVERGLSRVEPPGSVLVAYAAKEGTTATDGAGRNSPFTAALLKHLETPGLEVNFLFRSVRDEVMAATRTQQEPFIYGSLSREAIYLKDPAPTAEISPDEMAWNTIRDTGDIDLLRRFLKQYSSSKHREEAEKRAHALLPSGAPTSPWKTDERAPAPVAPRPQPVKLQPEAISPIQIAALQPQLFETKSAKPATLGPLSLRKATWTRQAGIYSPKLYRLPDGRHALMCGITLGGVYLTQLAPGKNQEPRKLLEEDCSEIRLTAAGTAFVRTDGGELVILDLPKSASQSFANDVVSHDVSSDGKLVALSFSGDRASAIYQRDGSVFKNLRFTSLRFHPDGRRAAYRVEDERTVVLGNLDSGTTQNLQHDRDVTDYEFSPDGKYLVVAEKGGDNLAMALTSWDTETGKKVGHARPKQKDAGSNVYMISGLNFSDDGRYLAVAEDGADLNIYAMPSLQKVGSLRGPSGDTLIGWAYFGSRPVLSADNTWLYAAGGELLYAWKLVTK